MLLNLRDKIRKNKILSSPLNTVIILDSVDSTNSYAKSLDNPSHLTVIVANNQTKGRGRDGREWKSFGEKNISLSLILDYPLDGDHLGLLSILTANAVVETIESLNLKAEVKWPNDILVKSKKISGILSEAVFKNNKSKYLIVGVGINVNSTSQDFDTENFKYRLEPTSVKSETGGSCSREDLILVFLVSFFGWIQKFKHKKYKEILDFWLKRYPDFGRTVSVLKNGEQIDGKIVNLSLNGELLLDVGGKIEIVNSGEIFA